MKTVRSDKQENPNNKNIGSLEGAACSVTHGIEVCVRPTYLPDQSEPEKSLFAFSYRVRIVNTSDTTAQLLNRHWKVLSAGKQIADVKGEGVIGEQPVLQPGEAFEYESWTVINDPVGSMLGSYTFVDENGEFLDVAIPEFSLFHLDNISVH